jgi:hypothetical protein
VRAIHADQLRPRPLVAALMAQKSSQKVIAESHR